MVAGINLYEWLFGYRIISLSSEACADAASLMLRMGINGRLSPSGRLVLGLSDSKRFIAGAKKEWIISVSEPQGAMGFLISLRGSIGSVLGAVIGLFLCLLMSTLIWDVRVEGNSEVSEEEIIASLASCDFSLGDPFWQKDIGRVEAALLEQNERLAWVSINRRGCVAYVKVLEREEPLTNDPPPIDADSLDIIATADGVVTEISLKSGTALVQVGDTVKRGDVLIGGYVIRDGVSYPTRAEGRITAQLSGELYVEVKREEQQITTKRGELLGYKIKIFSILINLLKNSGKIENECDIIENVEVCKLFGRYSLPIIVTGVYRKNEEITTVAYSKEEMPLIARERLSEELSSYLGEGELLRMRSSGEMTDSCYRLRTYFVYLSEIGGNVTNSEEYNKNPKGE